MSVRAALPYYFTDGNPIVTGGWHEHKIASLG